MNYLRFICLLYYRFRSRLSGTLLAHSFNRSPSFYACSTSVFVSGMTWLVHCFSLPSVCFSLSCSHNNFPQFEFSPIFPLSNGNWKSYPFTIYCIVSIVDDSFGRISSDIISFIACESINFFSLYAPLSLLRNLSYTKFV